MKMDKKSRKEDKKDPIELLVGKKVVAQTDKGVMYTGTLGGIYCRGSGLGNCLLVLSNVTIYGRKHIVKTPYILISMKNIVHLHLEPTEIIPKQEEA